mmetsp:Transcript_143245/g.445251  ORF Transcript_143245/g.445251 Transcript_143245/m.445251 type:complete len:329 (+) Transcript_143245:177-1163(+)
MRSAAALKQCLWHSGFQPHFLWQIALPLAFLAQSSAALTGCGASLCGAQKPIANFQGSTFASIAPWKTSGLASLNSHAFSKIGHFFSCDPSTSHFFAMRPSTFSMTSSICLCMQSRSVGWKAFMRPPKKCPAPGFAALAISPAFSMTSSKSSLSASMYISIAFLWKPTVPPMTSFLVHAPLPAQNISASSMGRCLTRSMPRTTLASSSSCWHAWRQPLPALHVAIIFAMATSAMRLATLSVHSSQRDSPSPTEIAGSTPSRSAALASRKCSCTKPSSPPTGSELAAAPGAAKSRSPARSVAERRGAISEGCLLGDGAPPTRPALLDRA